MQTQTSTATKVFFHPTRRTRGTSWAISIGVHLLFFLLRWGAQEVEVEQTTNAEAPVEIKLAGEIDVKNMLAPTPGQLSAAAETEVAATGQTGKRAEGRKSLSDIWKGVTGLSKGKSTSAFAVKSMGAPGLGIHTGAGGGGLPDTWKPQGGGKGGGTETGGGQLHDSAGVGGKGLFSGAEGSPWGNPGKGEGNGGGVRDSSGKGNGASGIGSADGTFGGAMAVGVGGGTGGEGGSFDANLHSSGGGHGSGGKDAFDLEGPLARRPLVKAPLPPYPDWAKEAGIEGDVTIRFSVLADGSVRPDILVKKTLDPRFDSVVVTTIKQWRFAPLGAGKKGEQWGLITFHFRLRG